MESKGGIAKFQEMSKDWENNPKILRKIIENLSEKIDELQAKATAYDRLVSKTIMSDAELDAPLAQKILREMCEKAEAYDRLMSGGKKTLKEWANFLGLCVSINPGLVCFCSYSKPMRVHNGWLLAVDERPRLIIPMELIDYCGDWEDSLTLPDGWEEKMNQEETFDYNLEQLGLK